MEDLLAVLHGLKTVGVDPSGSGQGEKFKLDVADDSVDNDDVRNDDHTHTQSWRQHLIFIKA